MPAPATTAELFALVEKSRLVSASVLGGYRQREGAGQQPPDQVADQLVRDGVLTAFQAALLLEGKTRPFFVGPYKVLSRLGNGSSGVVYLCEHVGMRRKVAVKVLQSRRAKDEVALQRFLREARAAAALNHPNVVHAIDLGREGDLHYLSMEYVDGSSLMSLVRAEGPLAPRRLAGYLRQAACGLEHAHAAGLIHRDITPSNVMVGRDGVVKLLDLGLALFADADENLTHGAPLGSLGYIAPEQALDGHAVDARSDIFSLGATTYFAMVGRAPDPRRGIEGTAPPKGSDPADFAQLMAIVEKMMAPNPAERFQAAGEVIEVVARWVPPSPPSFPSLPALPSFPTLSTPSPFPTPLPAASAPSAAGDSTDFTLGTGLETPSSDEVDAHPNPDAVTFAFNPAARTAAPAKTAKPAPRKKGTPPPARTLLPPKEAPARQPQAAPPAQTRSMRTWWIVAMTTAVVLGLGASLLTRPKGNAGAEAPPKLTPRPVSPNSP